MVTKGRLSLDMAAGMALLDGTDLLLAKKEFLEISFRKRYQRIKKHEGYCLAKE